MDEECCEVVVTAADADWLAGFTRTWWRSGWPPAGTCWARSARSTAGRAPSTTSRRRGSPCTPAGRWSPPIVARTGELHPYEVPCVIALPLVGGDPAYLRWVPEETRDPR